MKRIIALFAALTVLSVSMRADEGMWLLPLLQKFNADAMAQAGCKLSPEQIYSINSSSLKDAIVMFGAGCTGEIISDEGLLVTNHHCGYGNIQKLSSVEHDYLANGYWAMNRSQELPCEGLSVTFLVSIDDVTAVINEAAAKAEKKNKKKANCAELVDQAINEKIAELQKEVEAANPYCRVQIRSYYDENLYYCLVYKTYNDVRFVGAPPSSIGKFGADTDNWMWPRHTGDFSMFRVYADANNNPASYSADNVPYVPAQSLKVSLKGVQEGDYAMIMGYPGSTSRFQTSAQLKDMLLQNDIRIAARTARQNVLLEDMLADPAIKIQYASKYSGSTNAWKKWQGMKLAFEKLGIIERKEAEEAAFLAWVNEDAARAAKYSGVIDGIAAEVAKSSAPSYKRNLQTESIGRIEITSIADRAQMTASRMPELDIEKVCAALAPTYKDYSFSTDRKVTKAMIKFYRDNADPADYVIPGLADLDVDAYVDEIFDNTVFASLETLAAALKEKGASVLSSDPAAVLSSTIRGGAPAQMGPGGPGGPGMGPRPKTALQRYQHTYTEGQLAWKDGQASYPDANMSMRLTYGNVKGYSPADGVQYLYYTTLDGVMEKEDPNNWEFVVPAKLKELWASQDFGQYGLSNGKMPLCFLTNCDITGGNSGSPVLNENGALIGLAFDGNWESMSSDVMFEPDLQRCICVDIRYVLFIVDKFGGAGYLLDELNIEK